LVTGGGSAADRDREGSSIAGTGAGDTGLTRPSGRFAGITL
jgi:hypothetical protein